MIVTISSREGLSPKRPCNLSASILPPFTSTIYSSRMVKTFYHPGIDVIPIINIVQPICKINGLWSSFTGYILTLKCHPSKYWACMFSMRFITQPAQELIFILNHISRFQECRNLWFFLTSISIQPKIPSQLHLRLSKMDDYIISHLFWYFSGGNLGAIGLQSPF